MARPKKAVTKSEVLHFRFTKEQAALLNSLAQDYDVDGSELIRRALMYIDQARPALMIQSVKIDALTPEMAQMGMR